MLQNLVYCYAETRTRQKLQAHWPTDAADHRCGRGNLGMSGTVLIYNPRSGSGDHSDTVRERVAAHEYDIKETEAAGDGISLAEAAAETGYETIVAAGGDGTINDPGYRTGGRTGRCDAMSSPTRHWKQLRTAVGHH